jgi:hypothetical protein
LLGQRRGFPSLLSELHANMKQYTHRPTYNNPLCWCMRLSTVVYWSTLHTVLFSTWNNNSIQCIPLCTWLYIGQYTSHLDQINAKKQLTSDKNVCALFCAPTCNKYSYTYSANLKKIEETCVRNSLFIYWSQYMGAAMLDWPDQQLQ